MRRDDVDAFLVAAGKTLPTKPEWRTVTQRAGERRCYLPIAVDGRISNIELEMTVNLRNDDFFTINLLAPVCVARLCLSLDHFDRKAGVYVGAPHWHPWHGNRPASQTLPKELRHAESLAGIVSNKKEAFVWFLREFRIDSPAWPLSWPEKDRLL